MKYFLGLFLTLNFSLFSFETAPDLYQLCQHSIELKQWKRLERTAELLLGRYPESPYAREMEYFIAWGLFKQDKLDQANAAITRYLQGDEMPKYYEECMAMKFNIAQWYSIPDPLFGVESFPKFATNREYAIDVYDEIIATMPRSDLAARAYYQKGYLLLDGYASFKEAVEVFQTLIRRFPKHEKTPDAYLGIMQTYADQCKLEYPNLDLLDLATINFQKFKKHFPTEPRLEQGEAILQEMKHVLASNLYETARFYERTKKPGAAKLYYNVLLDTYPDTKFADKSHARLRRLDPQ